MSVKAWISAARLRTLPLALANMSMGNGLAAIHGMFNWHIAILSTLTAVSLQILSNFANDYGDSIHGADSIHREGPSRAVQTGVISSAQMKRAIIISGVMSFCLGVALLFVAFDDVKTIIAFIALGIVAIWAAYNYTAGDKPYGYAGLGDISVFIFFGLVAVMGCYFLQSQKISSEIILPAVTCGLLSVGVLNVNNIRDIDSDIKAGKRSIPVIIGRKAALVYHTVLILCAWSCIIIYTFISGADNWNWMFVISLPLFIYHLIKVYHADSPMALDPYLKQLALSTSLLVILFLVSHLAF